MSLPNLNDNNNKSGLPAAPQLPTMPTIEDNVMPNIEEEVMPEINSSEMPEIDDEQEQYIDEQDNFDEDKESFEEVHIEDVFNNDDSKDNDEIYQEADDIRVEHKVPQMVRNEEIELQDDYNPDYEEDLEKEGEHKYVDKKRKKLIPLGGKRSRRKVKSSEFDERENKLTKTRIIRSLIMIGFLLLFLLGLKNTFLPSHVYTSDQIKDFAAQGAGQTGFPDERGQAFVENFMSNYLTVDRSNPELMDRLSFYYGEDNDSRLNFERLNMSSGTDSKQVIITPPKVYEKELMTEYSAQYKVSTYVSDTDGSVSTEKGSAGRWLSFAVNVYYDKDKDSLAITPDSPIVVPSYKIISDTDVPERAPFGNGTVNNDIAPALNPTINGFVKAYAEASIESHDSILQYIEDKDDISLYDGFGGSVELSGDPSTAITRVIYDGDDDIYRAILTIKWIDTAAKGGENALEYTGRYIMRVNSLGDGKYSVSSFTPYTYYKKQ